MQARVAYIHPSPHGGVPGSHIPLDAFQNQPAGIVGALNLMRKQGVDLLGVNEAVERRIDSGFSLEKWLSDHRPNMVLIELHWYVHTHGALAAARTAKEMLPESLVVLGGLTASSFPQEILNQCPHVDTIIAGEAEYPLQLLATHLVTGAGDMARFPNLWTRGPNGELHAPTERWVADSLDEVDSVEMSWLENLTEFEKSDFPYRNRWLLVGRGCANACFFCGGSAPSLAKIWGREHVLVRSPEKVAADVIRLARSGVQAVHLTHDLLSLGKGFWEPFFRKIAESGVAVGLGNESWGPLPDREFLDAWASTFDISTSYIALSPTSAWSGLRKFASRGKDDERLLAVLADLAARGFPLHMFFLLNIPGETAETLQRTMDLAWAVVDSYPKNLLRIEAQTASIDPFSPAALGRTPQVRFARPSFDDYLAVSHGAHVPALNWPIHTGEIDPGRAIPVPRAHPKDVMALGSRCPSLIHRWKELLNPSE